MGVAAIVVLIAATVLTTMLALSRRTNARLPADGDVPVHFDIRGNADRFGSRWVVLGAVPASYVFMQVLLIVVGFFLEGEASAGEVIGGQIFLAITFLATHLFVIWLLLRWVKCSEAG